MSLGIVTWIREAVSGRVPSLLLSELKCLESDENPTALHTHTHSHSPALSLSVSHSSCLTSGSGSWEEMLEQLGPAVREEAGEMGTELF